MFFRLTPGERILRSLHMLPTPVMDAFGSVLFGRALALAVRRGVFDALAERDLTVAEIARTTGLAEEGVRLLVEMLTVAGYLRRTGSRYRPSAEGKKWLVRASPSYIGNAVRYFESLYLRWQNLEHTLDHGTPPQAYYHGFSDADWETYVLGMRDLARLLAPAVMRRIRLARGATQLLDLGGSHALYAIECCRRYPELKAVVVDFAPALRHAGPLVAESGMQERVHLQEGDLVRMELPGGQDGILLFNVIHGLSATANTALLRRCLGALKSGGKLYILDQFRATRRDSPLQQFLPLVVGLNLLNEIGGTSYPWEEVKEWCRGASAVRRIRLKFPGVSLVEVVR